MIRSGEATQRVNMAMTVGKKFGVTKRTGYGVVIALWLALAVACSSPYDTSAVVQSGHLESTVMQQCSAIGARNRAGMTITSASVVNAGQFIAPTPDPFGRPSDFSALPAFCRIAGVLTPTTDSQIGFELWLPEQWNGDFLQAGNGGAAGALVYGAMTEPLKRGYAVAHTDTGHIGGGGDFSWAVDHPERMIDYQHRAVRELTLVGKQLTQDFYRRTPKHAVWMGCSTGGRQGLKEVQWYPDDYDLVIAGAPANNWSALMMLSMWIERELDAVPSLLPKLPHLHTAAVAACDAMDGVVDGVVTEPAACDFDPGTLACGAAAAQACLTEPEQDAARRIYAGVLDASGAVVMPGTGVGSELEWAGYASPRFRIGSDYFRHVIAPGTDWQVGQLNVDRDLALAEAYDQGAAKAMEADIQAFVDGGGKLLLYHGTSDGLIPYQNTVNYFSAVREALGAQRMDAQVKLFLVPGMAHCAGGSGAHAVDWLAAAEDWLAGGEAPSQLLGHHPQSDSQTPAFTRPVCAFPRVPTYLGSGDVNAHASFTCQ